MSSLRGIYSQKSLLRYYINKIWLTGFAKHQSEIKKVERGEESGLEKMARLSRLKIGKICWWGSGKEILN